MEHGANSIGKKGKPVAKLVPFQKTDPEPQIWIGKRQNIHCR
jgi:antitoxin (DNA-binding transcriptional repressor) of toxin-antitoxin stability system